MVSHVVAVDHLLLTVLLEDVDKLLENCADVISDKFGGCGNDGVLLEFTGIG